MEECPCIIPDENDNCLDCGKPIKDMVDVPAPKLGDIVGICKLIDETAKHQAQLIKNNTDPKNPSLPKLRLIGGQMLRLPHKVMFRDLLGPSFLRAKALGYRGTFERWQEVIWEATSVPTVNSIL